MIEFLSSGICCIAGSQNAGVAALLVGLCVHRHRILAGLHIGNTKAFRVIGEHRVQLHGSIQLGTGIEERAAGVFPCGGCLPAVGGGNRSHRFAVALGISDSSTVGHFQFTGSAACSNRDVDRCGNRRRFPDRVGSQAPGGHGCGLDEGGRALRISKPSGKRIARRRSGRGRRSRQLFYTLLIFIGVNANC